MGIQTEYFKTPALVYDLAPERIKDLAAAIRFTPQTKINTDLRPVSYYQSFMLWSSYFHSSAKNMLNLIARIELWAIILILSLFIVMIMLLTRKMNRFLLPLLIALLGFAGMGAQIIIILVFQARFGYVYQMISLLTAAFMGGLAWGSYQINSHFEKITAPRKTMLLFLFPLLLYFASFIGMIAFHPLFPFLTQSLFPLSSLIIGSLVGAVFPLAVKFGQAHRKEIGHLAGVLYGADLLGSSLAAVLVSIFFVPLYGVLGTAAISVCAIVLSIAVVLVIK
jgi:spermidine synthase